MHRAQGVRVHRTSNAFHWWYWSSEVIKILRNFKIECFWLYLQIDDDHLTWNLTRPNDNKTLLSESQAKIRETKMFPLQRNLGSIDFFRDLRTFSRLKWGLIVHLHQKNVDYIWPLLKIDREEESVIYARLLRIRSYMPFERNVRSHSSISPYFQTESIIVLDFSESTTNQ